METLQSLPNITRLSERVVRVLGQNPGKFTLQGTNTYLLGLRSPYILVDTGEGCAEYPPILESALRDAPRSEDPAQPLVSDIVLTHQHHDHCNGLPSVLALLRRLWDDAPAPPAFPPPRLHKFPLPPDAPDTALLALLRALPPGSFAPPAPGAEGAALHALHAGQVLRAPGAALRVLHTPGHTADSVCLVLAEERAVLAADTVLGQGTAVFEDLAAYVTSLRALAAAAAGADGFARLYPGHGPVVEDGPRLVAEYIQHRQDREDEIVDVLQGPAPAGAEGAVWTLWDIVKIIYKAYPENLWEPAARGVSLYLKKLEGEGRVRSLGGEGNEGKWELVQSKM